MSVVYFHGDTVQLYNGKTGDVIDSWGVARTWYKVKCTDGTVAFVKSDQIDKVLKRYANKRKW